MSKVAGYNMVTMILFRGHDPFGHTKNEELWKEPIFRAYAEYSCGIFSQSDLPDLTKSP